MKSMRIMAMSVFLLVLTVPMISRAAEVNENIERLKGLGQACLEYMQDHDGQMPPNLSTLYYQAYVNDLSLFSSPSKPSTIFERSEIDEKSDYVLCPENGPIVPENPDMIAMKLDADKFRAIIRDRSGENNPKGKAMYAFFSDGSVSTLRAVMALEDEPVDREGFWKAKKDTTTMPKTAVAKENQNIERLKKLGQTCLNYMGDHNGQMPPNLSELYKESYVKDLSLFSSPSRPIGILVIGEIDEKSDYVLCPEKGPIVPEKPHLIAMKMSPDKFRPIIRDRSGKNNPKSKKMLVFFDDASVYSLCPVMFLEDETKDDVIGHKPDKDDQKTYRLGKKTGDTAVEVVRDFFPGHPLYIDMESRSGDTGILTSKKAFELRPGKYRIEFNLVGDPLGEARRVRFRVGDIYDDEVTLGADEMVKAYKREIVVTTPSTARLVFRHKGGDFQSLMLDGVCLTRLKGQNR